ncbi:MAG: hypothetical protein QF886_26125, partial [Planctomycetota bacterium]|nr:hypothetical protein [Planctomycetota bacterium]
GFREMGIRKNSLLLNGNLLRIRGLSDVPSNVLKSEESLFRLKEMGFNSFIGSPQNENLAKNILTASDKLGLYAHFSLSPPPAEMLADLNAAQAARYYAARIQAVQNHPSLFFWRLVGNGYANGPHGHPLQLANFENVKDSTGKSASSLLNDMDPTRPNYYEKFGAGGDMRSITQHFGPSVPIQSIEEWPLAWSETNAEPLLVTTRLMPLDYFFLWQREREKRSAAVAEHTVRYLGREAYRKMSRRDMLNLHRGIADGRGYWSRHPLYSEFVSMSMERILPVWRAMGVSYILHPEMAKEMGGTLDLERLKKWNGDIAAFISGPNESLVSKTHSYFPGEAISKRVIVLNDTSRALPVRVDVSWNFSEEGV